MRKIYVNGRFLSRSMTGVDRVAREICLLLSQNNDVDLCVLLPPESFIKGKDERSYLAVLKENGVEVRHIGRRCGHFWEQYELPRFQKVCTSSRPLLLNLCNTAPLLWKNTAVMIHDAQVWDVPATVSWKFRLLYRALLPRIASRSEHLMTVSTFSRQRLEHHGVFPAGKAHVVYNGVDHIDDLSADPKTLTKFGLQEHDYFLVLGSLAPHKNLELLMKAAAARPTGSPKLVIAGGINTKVFSGHGLREQEGVQFVGRVSDAELKALYTSALAMTFPSLTEGFGLPPLEAMRCGCPVIATTGGAVPEVLSEAALYVDPTDQQGWTEAMQKLAENAKLRKELSQKGFSHSAAFTWDAAVKRIAKAL